MRSRLYEGRVWHSRNHPDYRFEYTVWYLGIDLAEVAEAGRRLRLFSHNRFNLTSLRDRDYHAIGAQRPASGRSVELITMPRVLGYAFNPVSFYLHRDAAGQVCHVEAEVHNTWGERHVYELGRDAEGETYTAGAAKAFYVSPFIDMEGRYRFELREEASGKLHIHIDEHDGKSWFFSAGIDVRPAPLSDGSLARMLLRYPFVNLKTILMIHWQGLKLWRRGEPFRSNPSRRKRRHAAAGER